jgi:hypothetical protein
MAPSMLSMHAIGVQNIDGRQRPGAEKLDLPVSGQQGDACDLARIVEQESFHATVDLCQMTNVTSRWLFRVAASCRRRFRGSSAPAFLLIARSLRLSLRAVALGGRSFMHPITGYLKVGF